MQFIEKLGKVRVWAEGAVQSLRFSLVRENCASGPRLRHEFSWIAIKGSISNEDVCRGDRRKNLCLVRNIQSPKEDTLYYIGIDIAKKVHTAAIQLDDGTPKGAVLSFKNDAEGFNTLLARFDKFKIVPDNCTIAMESTGHYYIALYSFLVKQGFNVSVVNPVQINAFRKADTLRKTKTDTIDAVLIANFARFKQPESTDLAPETAEGLKELSRHRRRLVKERTGLKNRATATCDRLFPELAEVFGGLQSAAARAVMKEYGLPSIVANTNIRTLTKTLKTASGGRFNRSDAEVLKKLAKQSVGSTYAAEQFAFKLKQLVSHIEYLDSQISELEAKIDEIIEGTLAKHLLSIPGIGHVCASTIAAEIGSPDNFKDAKKLIAFAGIDPSKSQSGCNEGGGGHMSKRGSSYLRYALITAANLARKYDSYFGDYYDLMRARGKHHFIALSGVARKLAGVILAVLKEGRDYEPRPSIQSRKLGELAES